MQAALKRPAVVFGQVIPAMRVCVFVVFDLLELIACQPQAAAVSGLGSVRRPRPSRVGHRAVITVVLQQIAANVMGILGEEMGFGRVPSRPHQTGDSSPKEAKVTKEPGKRVPAQRVWKPATRQTRRSALIWLRPCGATLQAVGFGEPSLAVCT